MSGRSTHFFATPSDLSAILQAIEQDQPLQYVEAGRFSSAVPNRFLRSSEIPSLGIAGGPASTLCTSYLVSLRAHQIRHRQLSSPPSFSFDQLLNPETVRLTGGGLWDDGILIRGVVGTASEEASSLALMKSFRKALQKSCVAVRGNYVGPDAERLWRLGKRLTSAVQSPPEYDLA